MSASCGDRRIAFTLIELLITLGVIAVLLAIALPVLTGSRAAAKEATVLAHQAGVGKTLAAYIVQNDDRFPAFGVAGTNLVEDPPRVWRFAGTTEHRLEGYWTQIFLWAAHMALGKGWSEAQLATTGPEHDFDTAMSKYPDAPLGGDPWLALDVMTKTAFASPRYFDSDHPDDSFQTTDQVVQRFSSVAHPSDKGILKRDNRVRASDSAFIWFADGHAELLRERDLRQPMILPGDNPWQRDSVIETEKGLLGVDRR